jgi:hypothetical protein
MAGSQPAMRYTVITHSKITNVPTAKLFMKITPISSGACTGPMPPNKLAFLQATCTTFTTGTIQPNRFELAFHRASSSGSKIQASPIGSLATILYPANLSNKWQPTGKTSSKDRSHSSFLTTKKTTYTLETALTTMRPAKNGPKNGSHNSGSSFSTSGNCAATSAMHKTKIASPSNTPSESRPALAQYTHHYQISQLKYTTSTGSISPRRTNSNWAHANWKCGCPHRTSCPTRPCRDRPFLRSWPPRHLYLFPLPYYY